MSNRLYEKSLRELKSAGANHRCKDLVRTLTKMGFEVRDGSKQGHKVITHPGIASFTANGFTCGHGSNPEIKRVYINKIVKILQFYKSELTEYLGASL